MMPMDLVSIRKKAEEAVADMAEGPLKLRAFELILQSLLCSAVPDRGAQGVERPAQPVAVEPPSSIAERIGLLANEGFFAQPRSLGEIQESLAQHGWHYPLNNLSTPLIRLVRQRSLRRIQLAAGKKRLWKYSLP
jgi:hypothetical protein